MDFLLCFWFPNLWCGAILLSISISSIFWNVHAGLHVVHLMVIDVDVEAAGLSVFLGGGVWFENSETHKVRLDESWTVLAVELWHQLPSRADLLRERVQV